jgi:hypothetical protein
MLSSFNREVNMQNLFVSQEETHDFDNAFTVAQTFSALFPIFPQVPPSRSTRFNQFNP